MLLDERGSLFHWVTFIPRYLGKASAYLLGIFDAGGELLSGKQNYKLNVPAKVPAKNFWSVIAYSKATKSFIYNDADKLGLSSYDKSSLSVNDDGTIDIYFGEKAYFDKSFVLPDVERIN